MQLKAIVHLPRPNLTGAQTLDRTLPAESALVSGIGPTTETYPFPPTLDRTL